MESGTQKITAIFFVTLATLLLARVAYCQQTGGSYDGQWWLSITPEEQAGFLNGYLDCYAFEYGGPPSYWIENPEAAEPAITALYQTNPATDGTPVSEVFSRLPARQPDEASAATRVKERHSIYDGSYWKQISALGGPERGQLGFVEGYLACHAGFGHNRGGVFSRTPAEYMALISQWYRFDEYTGEINRRRARKPIAEVLERFKD
ncbi:MAG: hypothetical protein ACRD3D_08505 [Terriglobia bacterium]